MYLHPVTKALRKITPGHAGAIAVQNRFDEQPVIPCRHTHSALTARQQVSDTIPLVIPKGVAAHQSAPDRLTAYEFDVCAAPEAPK